MLIDLALIQRLAQERRDAFEVMRWMLEAEDDLDDAKLDRWVEQVAAPIIAAIDCTRCAHCCRVLDVYLEAEDGIRLAEHLAIPIEAVESRYVQRAEGEANDAWGMFRAKPCAFLEGHLCSVYDHRPRACRLYPQFTPDFRWTMADAISGTGLCPILYHVLDALQRHIDGVYAQLLA